MIRGLILYYVYFVLNNPLLLFYLFQCVEGGGFIPTDSHLSSMMLNSFSLSPNFDCDGIMVV